MRTTPRSPLPTSSPSEPIGRWSPSRLKLAAIGLAAAGSVVAALAAPAQAAVTATPLPGGKIYAGAVGDAATLQAKPEPPWASTATPTSRAASRRDAW